MEGRGKRGHDDFFLMSRSIPAGPGPAPTDPGVVMSGRVMDTPAIELNPAFLAALEVMEGTDRHVFVTGRAGTGKSTLLDHFRSQTRKPIVVLAPTGVAALNVRGQTIHSFFRFPPDVTPASIVEPVTGEARRLYRRLRTVVIDEVSMVRADLLDCVDRFLRLNGPDGSRPFGGVQMIFIGDLYQLPPVVTAETRPVFRDRYATPYFFSAEVMEGLDMAFVELEKVYRQRDAGFVRLLNAVRNGTVTMEDLDHLNTRCDPDFAGHDDGFIHLTATNDLADAINDGRLEALPGRRRRFRGVITGEFGREYLPTAPELCLKKGAQVMLLNNDPERRWVNGTIGKVTGFPKDPEGRTLVAAVLEDGKKVEIPPHTWEIYRFFLKGNDLASEAIGSFTQYPLRLAFAVTIHKSQGKTFDRVIIDVGRGTFAPGQMYVALSRCTSLEGLVLKRPLRRHHIKTDWRVARFLTDLKYRLAREDWTLEDKIRRLKEAARRGEEVAIVYLKARDEMSRRVVKPLYVGDMEYEGRSFIGLEALCLTRRARRVFNVERILKILDDHGRDGLTGSP